jgi:hypothetical protein
VELSSVLLAKGSIRLGYADKLNVRMRWEVMQKALYVAVHQTDNSDPYGGFILRKARGGKLAEEECDEDRFERDVAARGAHRQVRDSLTRL